MKNKSLIIVGVLTISQFFMIGGCGGGGGETGPKPRHCYWKCNVPGSYNIEVPIGTSPNENKDYPSCGGGGNDNENNNPSYNYIKGECNNSY